MEQTSERLSAVELRVLGCLIEKSFTTPENYPLTTNALTLACNQKTSRAPVVAYPSQLVDDTMLLLRDGKWARTVSTAGSRSNKHKHVAEDRLGLTDGELSVLAVLALRGPQSVGELATRTERYGTLADSAAVEAALRSLTLGSRPVVRNVGRASGQSQDRWVQLIGETGEPGDTAETGHGDEPSTVTPTASPSPSPELTTASATVTDLEERVAALEARVAELEQIFD